MGTPPFNEGDVGAAGLRSSCTAGLGIMPLTVVRLVPEVRFCRTASEDVPPVWDAAVAGGIGWMVAGKNRKIDMVEALKGAE